MHIPYKPDWHSYKTHGQCQSMTPELDTTEWTMEPSYTILDKGMDLPEDCVTMHQLYFSVPAKWVYQVAPEILANGCLLRELPHVPYD